MFNAVIASPGAKERRLGTGAIFSIATHAVIFGLIAYGTTHKTIKNVVTRDVVFTAAVPPPPPPPPPLGGGSREAKPVTKKPVPKKTDMVVTKDTPKPTPTQEDPSPAPAKDDAPAGEGDPNGDPNGVPGGVIGGVPGGTGTAPVAAPPPPPPPENRVLPFGEGMNRPSMISGGDPVFPRQAREARVEGTMLVKCVITKSGTLQNCRIIKSLPFMDQPVLEALAGRRYTPVTFQGKPVDVEYVIPFKFKLE